MKFKQIRIPTQDIKKLIQYIFREDSAAAKISTNILSEDYTKDLDAVAAIRPEVKSAFEHWVLSFSPLDRPSMQQIQALTKRFIAKMEMTPTNKFVAALHQDKNHLHVHIAISRVGTDGSLWLGKNSVERAMQITPELEREYGLIGTKTIDEHRAEIRTRRTSLEKHEFEQKKRTGLPTKKETLVGYVEEAITKSKGTWNGFLSALEEKGVHGKVITRANGSKGLTFTFNELSFKASALGKGYSYDGIDKAIEAVFTGKDYTAPQRPDYVKQLEQLKIAIEANKQTFEKTENKAEAEFQKKKILERITDLQSTCPKELVYQVTLLFYIVSAGLYGKHFYWLLKEHVKRLETEAQILNQELRRSVVGKSKSLIPIR